MEITESSSELIKWNSQVSFVPRMPAVCFALFYSWLTMGVECICILFMRGHQHEYENIIPYYRYPCQSGEGGCWQHSVLRVWPSECERGQSVCTASHHSPLNLFLNKKNTTPIPLLTWADYGKHRGVQWQEHGASFFNMYGWEKKTQMMWFWNIHNMFPLLLVYIKDYN